MEKSQKKDTRGVLKCYKDGKQYNLVAENGVFRIYYDFGRVMFEILTDSESDAINTFKGFFGKTATYDKFYYGFND